MQTWKVLIISFYPLDLLHVRFQSICPPTRISLLEWNKKKRAISSSAKKTNTRSQSLKAKKRIEKGRSATSLSSSTIRQMRVSPREALRRGALRDVTNSIQLNTNRTLFQNSQSTRTIQFDDDEPCVNPAEGQQNVSKQLQQRVSYSNILAHRGALTREINRNNRSVSDDMDSETSP